MTRTLITPHSLCSKPALGFPYSLLEEKKEELKCNAMRGIFRPTIDAPASKGRWQSAEQLLGVSRMQGDLRFPPRCTWSAIPHFAFSFQTTRFFPTLYFSVIMTDLQHTFSTVYKCFQKKVGSQGPVMNLVIKLLLVYLLFSALPYAGLCR